jgi:hypothetical protein
MTFKELALREDYRMGLPIMEEEESFFQLFIENSSPIMKLWFIMMAINFIFVLCLK